MEILIFGCDRLVTMLVPELALAGHHITIIDHDPQNLEIVADEPAVEAILTLEPQMQDYLRQGGIDTSDVFLALSGNDHENALVAQIAHHIFHVPKVICRLDNPQLQSLYTGLGLTVVGSTSSLLQDVHQSING